MQNKYKYVLTFKATEDIKNIYEYIANNLSSHITVHKLNAKFFEAIERITLMPNSCPVIKNKLVKIENVRKLVIDNYIMLYVSYSETKTIVIYRVFHGATNYIE